MLRFAPDIHITTNKLNIKLINAVNFQVASHQKPAIFVFPKRSQEHFKCFFFLGKLFLVHEL